MNKNNNLERFLSVASYRRFLPLALTLLLLNLPVTAIAADITNSFEGDLGIFNQSSGDDLNWTVKSGSTASSGTGPYSASAGSEYLYIEASGNGTGYPNKVAILTSDPIDLSTAASASVSFDYHMYGSSMGTLEVLLSSDGSNFTSAWSLSGDQGNSWFTANLDASAYAGGDLYIRFRGLTGNSYRSDIAIDNFSFATVTASVNNDYGDAPASYGDAGHAIDNNLHLGASVPDAESGSQYSYNAYGDGELINDGSGSWYMSGDEDGAPSQPVTDYIPLFPVLKMTDMSYSAGFKVNNAKPVAAALYGWIDFDQDGVFSADEAASATVPAGSFNATVNLSWNVPVDIQLGTTFIRLRLTTDSSVTVNTPTGMAADGEVEDFAIAVAMDIPPQSNALTITTGAAPQACQSVVFEDDFDDLAMGDFIGVNRGSATVGIRDWVMNGGGNDTYAHTKNSTSLGLGTSVYFGNGAVRRVSPAIGSGFSFDANGRMTTPLDAVELRDDVDDATPGTTLSSYSSASDWGPEAVTFSRSFTTEAGKKYRLYFKALPEDVGGSFVAGAMRLDMPGGSVHFKIPGSNEGAIDYSVEFTAANAVSTITFVNYGHVMSRNGAGWCDPASEYNNNSWCTVGGGDQNGNELIIDNVAVTESACTDGVISGFVYVDEDSNNSFSAANDTALPSVTVSLYNDLSGALLASTGSAADGSYSFSNLDDNLTYLVQVDGSDRDLPSGAVTGTPNPLAGLMVTGNSTLADQNFGFDLSGGACPAGYTAGAQSGHAVTVIDDQGVSREEEALGAPASVGTNPDTGNGGVPVAALVASGDMLTLDLGEVVEAGSDLEFSLTRNNNAGRIEIATSVDNVTYDVLGTYGNSGSLLDPGTRDSLERLTLTVPVASARYVRFTREEGGVYVDAVSYSRICTMPAPGEFCGPVMTSVMPSGAITHADNINRSSVIGFDYALRGTSASTPDPVQIASASEVGTVWGKAYDEAGKRLYVSAFLRRHAGLSPDGLGAIYKVDVSNADNSAAVGTPGLWLDLNSATHLGSGATLFPTETAANRGLTGAFLPSRDAWAYNRVGKEGIGGLDLSDDFSTLYAVDMTNRQLLVVDTGTKKVVARHAINDPGCAGGAGDVRPFGVDYLKGNVYVGVTCSGETNRSDQDVDAHVVRLENGTFTPVVSGARGLDWSSFWDDDPFGGGSCNSPKTSEFVPVVTNIQLDENDNMVIGVTGINGFRFANGNYLPDASCAAHVSGQETYGYVLRATPSGNNWVLSSDELYTNGFRHFFKDGQYAHWGSGASHTFLGGLAVSGCAGPEVAIANLMDALTYESAGTRYMRTADGQHETAAFVGDIALSTSTASTLEHYQGIGSTWEKSSGMGDIEFMSSPGVSVDTGSIFGKVYLDDNGNDSFDAAAETVIGAVTVSLLNDADGSAIASTSTAADGSYGFTSLNAGLNYRLVVDVADSDLPAGAVIGTLNPLHAVVVSAGNVTADQNFGFDIDLSTYTNAGEYRFDDCGGGGWEFDYSGNNNSATGDATVLDDDFKPYACTSVRNSNWNLEVPHISAYEIAEGAVSFLVMDKDGWNENRLLEKGWDSTAMLKIATARVSGSNPPGSKVTVTLNEQVIDIEEAHIPASGDSAADWVHVMFTFGAQGMKLYINGELKGTNAYTGGMTNVQGAFRVAAASMYFDEFYILDGQPDTAAVQGIYNNLIANKNLDGTARSCACGSPAGVGTIKGTVYADDNGNDAYDPGAEDGINAMTVRLYDDKGTFTDATDDTLLGTTSTDTTGSYQFDNVSSGLTHRIEVDTADADLPANFIMGTVNPLTAVTVSDGDILPDQNFGFDDASAYTNDYCVTPSGATGLLALGGMSTININGSGTFAYADRVLPGFGTVDVTVNMTGGIHNASTSAIDSGARQQSWLDEGLPVSGTAIYLGPNSGGTATVTYNFDQPTGNVDLLLLDVDEDDTLSITAKDGSGANITDFSGWRYRSGDLSVWVNPDPVAQAPAWNASAATVTSTDDANDHRSFGVLTPDTLVTQIVVTYTVPAVAGRHVYTILHTTAEGRDGETSCPASDLALNIVAIPTSVAPGYGAFFDVTVTNESAVDASGISVSLTLPAEFNFVSDTADRNSSGTDDEVSATDDIYDEVTGKYTIPSLAAGESVWLVINGTFNGPGTATLNGEITAMNEPDSDSTPNNASGTEDDEASASIDPAPLPGPVSPGTQSCTTGTDVLFVLDNSGSVTEAEYAEMAASIEAVGNQVLAGNPNSRIAIAHFGGPGGYFYEYDAGGQHVYIERDFSNAAMASPVRQFGPGGVLLPDWRGDYLAAAIHNLRYALDGDATTSNGFMLSPTKELSRDTDNPLHIITFTDSARKINNCCSAMIDLSGSAAEPGDGSNFTVYNTLKSQGATFSMVMFSSDTSRATTGAAIASTGGQYSGTSDSNSADPESAGDRRFLQDTTDLTLSAAEVELVAGYTCPPAFTAISGTVYADSNGDDSYDSGSESGIGSITVNLLNDADGSGIASTSTAVDGSYSFNELDAGLTYRIAVDTADTDLAGKTIGTTNPLAGVTVTAGNTTADQDFGFDASTAITYDYSDAPADGSAAPDGSSTTAYGVARHKLIDPNLKLGATVTAENSAVQDADNASDDGISAFPTLIEGESDYTIPAANISGSGSGTLHAWIDFDGNGSFETSEYTWTELNSGNAGDLIWSGQATMSAGTTWARFRLTSDALTDDGGTAIDERASGNDIVGGEVEDYAIAVNSTIQPTFTCDSSVYIASSTSNTQASQFSTIDTSVVPFVLNQIGNTSHGYNYNASGYREQDDYIYGVQLQTNHILRIGGDGSVVDLGAATGLPAPTGLNSSYDAGDVFPDGYLYVHEVYNHPEIYKIDVTTSPPQVVETIMLDQSVWLSDFAYDSYDGKIYGIGDQGEKFMIDPTTSPNWTVTTVGSNAPAASYGAAYTDTYGRFYVYRNNPGAFYMVDFGTDGDGTGDMIYLGSAPDVAFNDGASCRSYPPVTTGLVMSRVYLDHNGNDSVDSLEETMLPDITVSAYDENGTPADQSDDVLAYSLTSSLTGQMSFIYLNANSTYRFEVDANDPDLPEGAVLGTPNPVTNMTPSTGIKAPPRADFGFDPPPPVIYTPPAYEVCKTTSVEQLDEFQYAIARGSGATGTPTLNYTAPAGSNRMMLAILSVERDHLPDSPRGDNFETSDPGVVMPTLTFGGVAMQSLAFNVESFGSGNDFADAELSRSYYFYSLFDLSIPDGEQALVVSGINEPNNPAQGDEAVLTVATFANVGAANPLETITSAVDRDTPFSISLAASPATPDAAAQPPGTTASDNMLLAFGSSSRTETLSIGAGWNKLAEIHALNGRGSYITPYSGRVSGPFTESDGHTLLIQGIKGVSTAQTALMSSTADNLAGLGMHVFRLTAHGCDYGDAPASYGDAYHSQSWSRRLGVQRGDAETATPADANAGGDDSDGLDDEDGVTIPALTAGEAETIMVDVAGAAYLSAWIDWNGDGDFADTGEQIASDLQDADADGSIQVAVNVPADATSDQTYARFRWSIDAGAGPDGWASYGEVEDYAVTISGPVTELVCSDGSTPIMLDWSAVSWTGGDTSNTYTDVGGSGHDITINWRTQDAVFRSGRPRIANDPAECPTITGDYCAASTANVSSLTAEHAVEIIFSPTVKGMDVTIGDLQDKRDGGASANEIIEGIALTKGSSTGLNVIPGANIITGSVRTDYVPTTSDSGDDNSLRYIWNNTTDVSNVEFTMRNDNAGPGIYGNALSYNMSGIAFCPVVVSSGCSTVVTTTDDSDSAENNSGSLRDAIECANETAGADTITFDMPTSEAGYSAGTGVWTINPLTELPTLTDAGTTIDATTQTGAACGDLWAGTGRTLKVQLDGTGLASPAAGLTIDGADFSLRGLAVTNFPQYGLRTGNTADNAEFTCNHIGVAANGMTRGSNSTGMELRGAGAIVGGTDVSDGNVISGNSVGGGVVVSGADNATVYGNFIGVGIDGETKINNGIGIWTIRAENLQVGGNTDEQRNLISGNSNAGITFIGPDNTANVVQGNYIGTTKTGLATAGNATGINFGDFSNGITVSGNVISGNDNSGIGTGSDVGEDSHGNTISGNLIGLDKDGVNALPNNDGITLYEVNDFLIQQNRIANNTRWGIMLQNGADNVTISSNSIFNNALQGIDLQSHDGSFATSTGVTLNDATDSDDGANQLLNFPVLSRVVLNGGDLIITGCAPAGAVVELFEADVSPGGAATPGDNQFGLSKDYGEGQTYLVSLAEGSVADSDPGSCSVPGEDGNDYSGLNGFYFSVPVPADVAIDDVLTATATLSGTGTSEFGPMIGVSDTPPTIGGGSCTADGGTDILFIVDNSGSITSAEYAEFSQTIETVGAQFLADNATNRVAVAHFGGPSDSLANGGQYVYIERDFSTGSMTAPVRQFGHDGAYNSTWTADHLAGAVEQMRYALDGDAATSSNLIVSPLKETSRDLSVPLQIVLMTDAARYLDNTPSDISMLVDPAGSGAEPNDGSDYTVYNQLKTEGVSFSVVSFNPNSTDIAASAAIASVGGAYTGTVDTNTADPEGSQTTPRRYISVTSGFSLTTDQVLELAETTAICGSSISGSVFEDLLYGGGNGRPLGATGTVGLSAVTIEVYDSSGAYVASVVSNVSGDYRLPSLPDGDYFVRVVNDTVSSGRGGSDGSEVAVMTYRSNGVTAVLNEVGGRYPGSVDGDANTAAATLNTTSFVFSGGSLDGQVAQSVQPITLNGSSVQNADFGFNFNTIVNANSAGQGSLAQFIYNSNLLDSTGITQSLPVALSGDYTSGDTVAVFMIPVSQLSGGQALISPVAELSIEQARTVIDGRVQLENIGSGEIVISGDGSTPNAGVHFTEAADGSVLRDVRIENFGGAGISIYGTGGSGTGVIVNSVAVINNNQYGILLQNAAANNKIIESTISDNNWMGINNEGDSNNTYSRNSIVDNGALGIDLEGDGVTANSNTDAWLNYPDIGSDSSVSSNGSMIVSYDFDLEVPANTHGYRVEFFSNTSADPSGHGEGETYLGYVDITHPGTGSKNFKGSFNASQVVPAGANIALTLTEKTGVGTLGATSEFSGINNGGLSVCTDLLLDPDAELPNVVLDENSTVVTYLEARDANGNPVTYTISGGADSAQFVIHPAAPGALFDCITIEFIRDDGIIITKKQEVPAEPITKNGAFQLPPPGDYEAPMDSGRDNTYDLEITVTDSQGNTVTKPVSVVVRDVNEKPYITSAEQVEFEELQEVSNVVIDLEAYDPDAGDAEGSGLTYSISGGPDAAHFRVDRLTGELRFKASPNYDLPADSDQNNDYVLDVRVTDDQGYAGSKTLTVTVTDNPELGGIRLSIRALLQGAYKSETGLMTDTLRSAGVLPVAQPYGSSRFNYQGSESINLDKVSVTGSEAMVDWVLVELRSSADPAQVVATQAALILRNGNVVDAALHSTVLDFPDLNPGQYYVSLRHRNHLGVMTAEPVAVSAAAALTDFTNPGTAVYGEHARFTTGSIALLWSGDASQDGKLIMSGQGSDMNVVLVDVLTAPGNTAYNSSYQVPGYLAADLNMDGKVIFSGPANDANILLGNILLHPANTGFASNFIAKGGMP